MLTCIEAALHQQLDCERCKMGIGCGINERIRASMCAGLDKIGGPFFGGRLTPNVIHHLMHNSTRCIIFPIHIANSNDHVTTNISFHTSIVLESDRLVLSHTSAIN